MHSSRGPEELKDIEGVILILLILCERPLPLCALAFCEVLQYAHACLMPYVYACLVRAMAWREPFAVCGRLPCVPWRS